MNDAADARVDASPPGTAHLLITEVMSDAEEFIEIWNPTNKDVDLSNYYVSDYGSYWKLPDSVSVMQDDFIARFPAGAVLPSGQVLTIATNAANFTTQYGKPPTYGLNIAMDTGGAKAFRDRILGMPATLAITNSGEYLILFYWDGNSDNVKDVDIVLAGSSLPTASANQMVPKAPVDGPDIDNTKTPYKAENNLFGGGMSMIAPSMKSYKRSTLESGAETQDGTGNGLFGDDETSEQFKSSWDGDSARPHSAPNPGVIPSF